MVEAGNTQRDALLDEGDALLHRHIPFAQAPHAGDDARQDQAILAGGGTGAGEGGGHGGAFLLE
jgi:hypothetical protein